MRLSVNLNKVALLRNQREIDLPSVSRAAETVLAAGASGVTLHPRPDQRHSRPDDVRALRKLVEKFGAELNVEGNPQPGFVGLIAEVQPHQVTLVPDAPEAKTSDRGWNLDSQHDVLGQAIGSLKPHVGRVSVFMDHDADFEGLSAMGADAVELYTEPYAAGFGGVGQADTLADYVAATGRVVAEGLEVHAGHDLNLTNLPPLLAALPMLAEISVGHAFTAEALWLGLEETTRRYLELIDRS